MHGDTKNRCDHCLILYLCNCGFCARFQWCDYR